MRKLSIVFSILVMAGLLLSACGGAATKEPTNGLEQVLQRGTLIVSSDPAYPPQSELVEAATRPADTKCAADQRTAAELAGFDIDTSVEIAKRLEVEVCFVTPDWTLITAGSWADRWDLSVGSMTIIPVPHLPFKSEREGARKEENMREAKFSIGQVVRHRLFPFRGVVFDVDSQFANTEKWLASIPGPIRPRRDQPFYHLLAENSDSHYLAYVSEQNLLPDETGEPVTHPQVPILFEETDDGSYKLKPQNLN